MFNKILVGYDGSVQSVNTIKLASDFAKKFKSNVHAVYVLPKYKEFTKSFTLLERELYKDWIDNDLINKNSLKLDNIKRDLKKKRIKFSYEFIQGLPYKEILKYIRKNNYRLVVLGKGRFKGKAILGGTALKVLRNTDIPVLVADSVNGYININSIKNILVPTDIYKVIKNDLLYAEKISQKLKSKIHLLNIIETGDHKYPIEMIETMKGNSYTELAECLQIAKIGNNVEPSIRVAKNAWIGITNYVNEQNIDLVILNTYGGNKIRSEFLGSTAEKVIQESKVPVIAFPVRN